MAGESNDLIRILLVGRTGNGKSSTGNSILGTREFDPQSGTSSAAYIIKSASSTIEGMPLIVVDGSGVGDTSADATEDGQFMISLVEKALSMTSNKFDALLIVAKYGVRFTKQEQEAMQMIKTLLGEDVIKNYGIIIMTHGDNFDADAEEEGSTFESWCDNQTGDIHDLFDECDRRRVLFDNRTKDEEKKAKQTRKLLDIIADLKRNRSSPYTEDDFKKAEPARKKLIVKGKLSELESKTDNILDSITKRLDDLKKQDQVGDTEKLDDLNTELQEHKMWLEQEDEGTRSVDYLLKKISVTETRMRTMIDIKNRIRKIAECEGHLGGQQAKVIGHKEADVRADTKNIFLTLITFLCYVHWSVIYFVISLALIIRVKPLVTLVDTIVGIYIFICTLVLPFNVMTDKQVVDAINNVKAKISSTHSSRKSD